MSYCRNGSHPYDEECEEDYEEIDENMTPEYFNTQKEEIIHKIKLERDIYSKLLNEILDNSKSTKEKLDMYYDNLQWYHSIVQTSVIIVSTGSTFLQSILDKAFPKHIITTNLLQLFRINTFTKFFKLDECHTVHNLYMIYNYIIE